MLALIISWLIIGSTLIVWQVLEREEGKATDFDHWVMVVVSALFFGPILFPMIAFANDTEGVIYDVSVYHGEQDNVQ